MKNLTAILCLVLAVPLGTAGVSRGAEVYRCIVNKKIHSQHTYSKEHLGKWKPSVVVVDNGDSFTLKRCGYSSVEKDVTCDEYVGDRKVIDPGFGGKKYYHFGSQFDVQVFPGLTFLENNGRGSISFGVCEKF